MPKKPDHESSLQGAGFPRLERPLTLAARVEQLLRQEIAAGRFADGQLPTEVELAEQLGVSRETVRLAAEVLQQEGLLVKIRRKGTFTQPAPITLQLSGPESSVLALLQADYLATEGNEESVTNSINALMLQGALSEAGRAGWELLVRSAPHTQMRAAFRRIKQKVRLAGMIFASFGEEKLLRQVTGLGIPVVLMDHEVRLPQINSVREDSFAAAREAVQYLIDLGHRRIAIAQWQQTDLNPWRLDGYRQALRDAGVVRKRQWELSVELTERGARLAVEKLLALSPRPTAIYCFNNTLAKRIAQRLREKDVAVPEEVGVVGGGGEEVAGLTCHQADWLQIGRLAVQVLLERLGAPQSVEPEHRLVPHALRIAESTAPPHEKAASSLPRSKSSRNPSRERNRR